MAITSIDWACLETRHWDESLRSWRGSGFTVGEWWGSDGNRSGPLAEGLEPAPTIHFLLEDAASLEPDDAVQVAQPLADSHWGTRLMLVEAPDGRVHALEEIT